MADEKVRKPRKESYSKFMVMQQIKGENQFEQVEPCANTAAGLKIIQDQGEDGCTYAVYQQRTPSLTVRICREEKRTLETGGSMAKAAEDETPDDNAPVEP